MKKIRTSFTFKVLTVYLSLNLIFPLAGIQTGMFNSYALTGGPSQPEFNSFTPIGTSDMVDLASGDFNYNIPIMDVGGYPLNLSYNSGITMDQEASWVGLGWNLNVGQINRNVRGLPDDFDGDVIEYENNLKDNKTIGANFGVRGSLLGWDNIGLNVGMGFYHNNYNGFYAKPSVGITFDINDNITVGMDISATTTEGATVTPSASISTKIKSKNKDLNGMSHNYGVGFSFNSRQAISSLNLSSSVSSSGTHEYKEESRNHSVSNGSFGGSISFNDYMSFTPSKRVSMESENNILSIAFGVDLTVGQTQFQLMGSQSKQWVKNKFTTTKAYGYENTNNNTRFINGILDFNREKERSTVNKHTKILPITNYTYDIYNINGQGIGGMFKPFRSQVGYVNDQKITDIGSGKTIGGEFGVVWNVHTGFDYKETSSRSSTSVWENKNYALNKFKKSVNNDIDFEETYFKSIGDLSVDSDTFIEGQDILKEYLGGYQPIKIGIGGGSHGRYAKSEYRKKLVTEGGGLDQYETIAINNKIKRTNRAIKNQSIQKITRKEAVNFGLKDKFIHFNYNPSNDNIKHHTAAIKILKNDGSTYYYGNAIYNTNKTETTFDVSGRSDINCRNGTITYTDIYNNHSNRSDKFLNRTKTPAYAYTYLLTSILSSDYQDLNNNGPDDNDLGSYTKFNYNNVNYNYKWRVPYKANEAMYNEGLISVTRDQKANYIYGEKQMQYINSIETKTHIAFFELVNRKDGFGVKSEHITGFDAPSKKIKSITLYSKPEYFNSDGSINLNAVPIKTAHFEYNYSLCGNVDNNKGISSNNSDEEPDYNGFDANHKNGKLTLKKVYFTYANSKMGKYNPYKFDYANGDDIVYNPDYHLKDYDIWGNYKPNDGDCNIDSQTTTSEFPFVIQDKDLTDKYSSAWSLTSIDLPSGGKIDLEFESDDYQFVQDKDAMQMFKVLGFGDGTQTTPHNNLFLARNHDISKYLYIELNEDITDNDEFIEKYLKEHLDKPIFFKFLLNMSNISSQYDFVSGYFDIDKNLLIKLPNGANSNIVAIPLKFLNNEGGWVSGDRYVNPISKAGWYFGRTNLNSLVYRGGDDYVGSNFISIVNELKSSIGSLGSIFKNANQVLEDKGCARKFKPDKSWIRLLNPNRKKLGGGIRVKKLMMYDNWATMTDAPDTQTDIYDQFYGQNYSYDLSDGNSSGVATFEPNGSKENPFVEPFYDARPNSKRDKLAAPQEFNYVEKPIGESFFPGAAVTYSKVTVNNIERKETHQEGIETIIDRQVKKHATGKIVNEFYTSKDFPTITDYTDVLPEGKTSPYYDTPSTLGGLLNIDVRYHLTLSQGFVIHTNDMNAKQKSQIVYAEGNNAPLSSVSYKYSTDFVTGQLKNDLPTINEDGIINYATIGEHYDVINDFKQYQSKSNVDGFEFNFSGFVLPFPLPIWVGLPIPIPSIANHEDKVSLATTTKVIHTSGILIEKIATDLGSTVLTENLAWDAVTGQVLVTKTKNEYDDAYYSLNYPAHWKYKNMGLTSKNIDLKGYLKSTSNEEFRIKKSKESTETINASEYFTKGDELIVDVYTCENYFTTEYFPGASSELFAVFDILNELYGCESDFPVFAIRNHDFKKLWVVDINGNNIILMDELGKIINSTNNDLVSNFVIEEDNDEHLSPFKLVKSGYRNIQTASMASITSMVNPIDINEDNQIDEGQSIQSIYSITNPNIVNASAIEYTDLWSPQCECLGLPNFAYNFNENGELIDQNGLATSDLNPNEFAAIRGNPLKHFNPYLYNVKGNYKATKSYAFLTGRDSNTNDVSPRADGYLSTFSPFYKLNGTSWIINPTTQDQWTFASQVSKYSPHGVELENKDALNRYSSAQYGFNYTLPTAVSSNSKYTEMGFDSFEDYKEFLDCTTTHFGFRQATVSTQENAIISNESAHTGRKSIKVNPGTRATLEKRIDQNCD